jgi:hypothetical protein
MDMAAAVASHPVKIQPENETWWINGLFSTPDLTIIRRAHPNEIPPGDWPVSINGNWARG